MPIAFPRTFASDIPRRCAEVIASGKPHDFGEIFRPPDRSPAGWLAVRAFPLGDDTVGLSLVDLTERRMQERSLRRQERFLGAVLENLPIMVFVKDATDLRFLRFNKAGEELLGVAREDLLGRGDHDLFPPEEADFFVAKDRAAVDAYGSTLSAVSRVWRVKVAHSKIQSATVSCCAIQVSEQAPAIARQK